MELDRETISAGERLKVIPKHGVGLNNVDVAAATENDVVVACTPGHNDQAVAEHAFGMLFAVRMQFLPASLDVKEGAWARERYVGPELRGDTLGIYGAGDIGARVAELAASIGMLVVAFDPYVDSADAPAPVEMVDSSSDLAAEADALSVYTPLTGETEGIINRDVLEQLPSSGIVVNCARGGIVDEDALDAVLVEGEIAGASLDVFVEEPPKTDHPLLTHENVIATPHCAGLTNNFMRGMSEGAAANVREVYEGRVSENAINSNDLSVDGAALDQ